MTTAMIHDQNLEKQNQKQICCMTGFIHFFDRNQILNGKRLYSTKRLPPSSPHVDSASDSEKAVDSPSISTELVKVNQRTRSVPSPDRFNKYRTQELRSSAPEAYAPAECPAKMPLPLPMFDIKEGTKTSWKFRETPRLSLDSRAIVDAKGSLYPREVRTNAVNDDNERQHRSPSVIARLMGLEQLPEPHPESMMKKAELRRSASESRVNRDLKEYRFIDPNNNFEQTQNQSHTDTISNARFHEKKPNARQVVTTDCTTRSMKYEPVKINPSRNNVSQWRSPQQRKSLFDSDDFFSEPKQTVSIYREIEKKLTMRGIDEPWKDLETLKQILDAFQLKGLLHSKKSFEERLNSRNFSHDRHYAHMDSPIVLMKPLKSQPIRQRRNGNESPPFNNISSPVQRCNLKRTSEGMNSPRVKPACSPSRSESSVTSPSSGMIRRKPLIIVTPRRGADPVERRRVSPVHSAKVFSRKTSSSDHTQSPRNRKLTASIHPREETPAPAEQETWSISDSMSSQTDSERKNMEEFKGGRNLLDRCNKVLHSIAEMNTSELQPSPVSVLDSPFYKDDSSSPSPVLKRSIDYKDQGVDLEDDVSGSAKSPVKSQQDEELDDCDYVYISDIVRAYNYLPEEKSIFLLLEKQQCHKGKVTSKVCTHQRKLIFDTIAEILDRNRQLPPWKAVLLTNSSDGEPSLRNIWSEFKKISEREESEELFEAIFGVLKKDLDGDAFNSWRKCHMEKSEAIILDIERSIFKDLVGEMIRDLAAVAGKGRRSISCRKLMF